MQFSWFMRSKFSLFTIQKSKSMKVKLFILSLLFCSVLVTAQKKEVYNPKADAVKDIENAIKVASKEGKHVFLQIGGNWCPWCIKFHNFIEANSELKSFMESNYEVVKVNYDRENKQANLLGKLGFPQRFGFPVFVILDADGNRIHTQNSAFLEKDKSYDESVVMRFFKNWSSTAVDPASYTR